MTNKDVFTTLNKSQEIIMGALFNNMSDTTLEGHTLCCDVHDNITKINVDYYTRSKPVGNPPWQVVVKPTIKQRVINFLRRGIK